MSEKRVSEQPLFEIVKTTTGAVSIRNNVVNEIMHNPVGPWVEANSLYIEQSQLAKRLLINSSKDGKISSSSSQTPFVVFDVGLGAAANSIAAIHCARAVAKTEGQNCRSLQIVSFERELELLEFAVENAEHFEHFQGYVPALRAILDRGEWSDQNISWNLRKGDFLDLIDHETFKADLIFFDPYSPAMNQDMWTSSCFTKLRQKTNDMSEAGAMMYTYSQATRVRAAMIQGGYAVGYGAATGLKNDTTEASTLVKSLKAPLGPIWYDRWKRSHVRYPYGCAPEAESAVHESVEKYINENLDYLSRTEVDVDRRRRGGATAVSKNTFR
jgi:tRNA U34 5-methylaminomethyl-2-thiouridine-forming methyltransferase MnmC